MTRFASILAAALALFAPAAFADVTFGASVTNANGTLSTRLTWSTNPVATGCTASGHPSWTGAKAASGSLDLPAITLSGTYNLALSCTRTGDTQAVITWAQPTTNTDGTALTRCATATTTGPCLARFQLYRSTASTMTSPQMRPIDDPTATTSTWGGLPSGTHYFAVEAVNGNSLASALSNVLVKVTTATAVENASVRLTVNPIPSAPTLTTVE